jgi:hypothetical protein
MPLSTIYHNGVRVIVFMPLSTIYHNGVRVIVFNATFNNILYIVESGIKHHNSNPVVIYC